jgi:hypothetical protein
LSKEDPKKMAIAEKSDYYPPESAPVFERTTVEELFRAGFQQELIYEGRSGDTLEFLYKEILGRGSQHPLTQTVSHDLRQGNTIRYRGAQIEVVEATNTHIEYRMFSNFR